MALTVASVVSFDSVGLASPGVLFQKEFDGKLVRLSVGPASMTKLEVLEEKVRVAFFQPIFFEFGRRIILTISVNGDMDVFINSVRLKSAETTLWPIFLSANKFQNDWMNYQPRFQAIVERHLPILERRFIQKVKKIESLLIEGGEGNILDACGSLRPLLLDDFLDQVNRNYRVKINYKLLADQKSPPIDGLFFAFGPIYLGHVGAERESMNKEKFLKYHAAYIEGKVVTIKQIVKLAANSLGAHHFGSPVSDCDLEAAAFNQYDRNKVNAEPILLFPMTEICLCFLDAINPLISAILERHAHEE